MASAPEIPDGTFFGHLTPSTSTAMGWAGLRAEARGAGAAAQKGSAGSPSPVLVPDLLVGILLSHGESSAPLQLLRWAGIPYTRLEGLLQPTGFLPSGASGDPDGWMKRFQEEYRADGAAIPDRVSSEALQALHYAGSLASSHSPEAPMIRLRDLFGGILLGWREGQGMFASLLEGSPLDMATLWSIYPSFLKLDASHRLEDFLTEQFPDVIPGPGSDGNDIEAAVEPPPPPPPSLLRVAVPDPDRTGTEDLVGIGPEVDAFAYLMTAPALHPPLAVGLFGDWGSGKSFFMESLKRRIDDLTEAARISELPQSRLPVFRHVAQIEFNAWHYVEGNLWASLVEHIFQTLAGVEDPDDPSRVEEKVRDWSRELDSQRVARSQVESRLLTLEKEREAREKALEESLEKRREKLQALKQARVSDAMASVTLDEGVRRDVGELLDRVGLQRVQASALETSEALNDARALLQRGNALLTPLRTQGSAGWRWAFLLVGVALAGPLVSWALTRIPDQPLDAVTRTLTGIATFFSFLALSLRKGSQWLSTSLQGVESAQSRIEEIRARKAGEMAAEEANLQHELEELDRTVARMAERKAEIDRRIETIQAEIADLTPARLISNFIDERVGSEDYRKHLGVPALIRRDFRRLSRLVEYQNKALMDGKEPDPTRGGEMVNRVILYIDDLDRCPPERVVEVLQAVHLLLAFELFVVVVAVDSRWLSRSLVSHYQSLLNGAASQGADGRGATPDDYLEKIFQIPFHVRPLTDEARARILHGLLGPDPAAATSETGARLRNVLLQAALPAVTGPGGSGDAPGEFRTPSGGALTEAGERSGDGGEGREVGDAGAEIAAGTGSGGVAEGAAAEGTGEVGTGTAAAGDTGEDAGEDASTGEKPVVDLNPSRLRIGPDELAFMDALRPLLGRTPRSVKRFVNVYRLLTAIAGSREISLHTDEEIPPFQLAMFLLALVTGLPGMAAEILGFVERGARAARTGQREESQMTLEWVMDQYTSGALHYRPEGPTPEYRALRGWLDSHAGGSWKEVPLSRLAPWIDPVSRFTFRSEVGVRG